MNGTRKTPVTELNAYDRKILDRYTRAYTNMIESSIARTELPENMRDKALKLH